LSTTIYLIKTTQKLNLKLNYLLTIEKDGKVEKGEGIWENIKYG
jgi:hypothetical protein